MIKNGLETNRLSCQIPRCVVVSVCFRLERLDHLAKKFKHKCDIHEEWAYGKEDMLQAQDFKQCRLNELKVSEFYPFTTSLGPLFFVEVI